MHYSDIPLNGFTRSTWLSAKRRPALSSHWRNWLCDKGSLTEALIRASHGQFSVKLLSQNLAIPTKDEASALGLNPKQRVLIREVELLGHQQPWVYARSVVPVATLKQCHQRLNRLGSRSLGTMLFTDPTIKRGDIELCHFYANGQAYPSRRSVFWIAAHPLLVTEIFLPPMQQITYHPNA
ncbi:MULTISPECIES: chorismate--pyruvate lyase family protein [Nitrincola]|uniref:Probable chorismate pyruvate-lyase n=1 Tax=Nitrincola nitratireducens TaxID=1229521 RepID=W9UR43_9GAMM|nr:MULTISPECIES: chorismate lyase [Nitrincola]EXJ09688.1 Chorismate--pyruvate lyase [Nitrincola nitratireducens]